MIFKSNAAKHNERDLLCYFVKYKNIFKLLIFQSTVGS